MVFKFYARASQLIVFNLNLYIYLTIVTLEGMGNQGVGRVFREVDGKVIFSGLDRCGPNVWRWGGCFWEVRWMLVSSGIFPQCPKIEWAKNPLCTAYLVGKMKFKTEEEVSIVTSEEIWKSETERRHEDEGSFRNQSVRQSEAKCRIRTLFLRWAGCFFFNLLSSAYHTGLKQKQLDR